MAWANDHDGDTSHIYMEGFELTGVTVNPNAIGCRVEMHYTETMDAARKRALGMIPMPIVERV